MKVRVDNEYTDGHKASVERTVDDVEEPGPGVDEGELYELFSELYDSLLDDIGDGHGASRPDLGRATKMTILSANNPALVDESYEWFDAPSAKRSPGMTRDQ
ncbi:hypothetical protein BKG82_27845 [Mycobacteroides chelonae]|uniref:Uncharacterized protein n=1 Tax=Mycobacteroides chelonae TaxID=1774 RepID=A0A1S1LJD3_MYCCH|nr:hypothetical protein [Mycobacteroides chelonae]OHU47422.1 hypothetical protein BKG82_27845 [Mycobacteroides chelonae]